MVNHKYLNRLAVELFKSHTDITLTDCYAIQTQDAFSAVCSCVVNSPGFGNHVDMIRIPGDIPMFLISTSGTRGIGVVYFGKTNQLISTVEKLSELTDERRDLLCIF